jgi:hypothetical protein
MAKKKKKQQTQTPKDDLIHSILNDVQEINDEDTKHEVNAGADLFLGDYENTHPQKKNDVVIGLGGDENRIESTGVGTAAALWEQIKGKSEKETPHEESELSNTSDSIEETSDVFETPDFPSQQSYPVGFKDEPAPVVDDKTIDINALNKVAESPGSSSSSSSSSEVSENSSSVEESVFDSEKTVAVEGFANRQPQPKQEVTPKVSLGALRPARPNNGGVYASPDATLAQAETLKLAQQRILELEREVEKYRQENEALASAGDIVRNRAEELTARIFALEKEKQEVFDSLQNELMIVKGSLQYKESEMGKARLKIEELEARLKSDFKKIRVRERELENRLELVKAEKTALLRAKDENILELKRKIDHLESELDNYRRKVLELNKTIEINQDQFKRTVRALRLALSNLEVKEENIVPLKKAD